MQLHNLHDWNRYDDKSLQNLFLQELKNHILHFLPILIYRKTCNTTPIKYSTSLNMYYRSFWYPNHNTTRISSKMAELANFGLKFSSIGSIIMKIEFYPPLSTARPLVCNPPSMPRKIV